MISKKYGYHRDFFYLSALFLHLLQPIQPEQPPQPPFLRETIIYLTALKRSTNINIKAIISAAVICIRPFHQNMSIPILYTANAAIQAAAHWIRTNASAAKDEFISRLTAATAATQGVYKSENTRKLTAVIGVNIP